MHVIDHFTNEKENLDSLRQYIWLCETGMPYLHPEPSLETHYFLGTKDGTGYYFFYEPNVESVLNMDTLSIIKSKCDNYIIHAHQCLLSQEYLRQCNIIFKKIPDQLCWMNRNNKSLSDQRLEVFKIDSVSREL